jgi:hypothetical protein
MIHIQEKPIKILLVISAAIILVAFSGGCGGSPQPTATLNDLVTKPEQFSGKTVTVDGIYVNGWESTVLTENITFSGSSEARELKASENSIWFAGFVPLDISDKLYQHTSPLAGPQHYGKLRVTGLFETGGKYGNTYLFKYRITVKSVEMLDWTPPE